MRDQDDENARPDVVNIVDATGDDFYALGSDFASPFGAWWTLDEETQQPSSDVGRDAIFDPRCLRMHDLLQKTPSGSPDRRFSIQTFNDPDGPYGEPDDLMAPKQPEHFSALNRSTREADAKGRTALPCSTRLVVDAHDGRYALAHVIGDLELGSASSPEDADEIPPSGPTGETFPPGVAIKGVGSDGGTGGSVTRSAPSVSVQGVTFFGHAAVEAARQANARGGSAMDIARAASHASRGLPPPPASLFQGGGPGGAAPLRSQTRADAPPTPTSQTRPGPSAADRPEGYITDRRAHGLLGTFFTTQGTSERYFDGSEGTPIRRAAARFDAHFAMGGGDEDDEDLTGAIRFVTNDATDLPRSGKWVKGEMRPDRSLANQDTEVGQETVKWVPCVPMTADLPPSVPPPDGVPSGGVDLRSTPVGGGAPGGAPGGGGGAGGSGNPEGKPQPEQVKPPPESEAEPRTEQQDEAAAENPAPTSSTPDDDDPRDLPIPTADNQARDFGSPGMPCPNRPGGMLVEAERPDGPRRGETTTEGGKVVTTGFPGIAIADDGNVTVGGEFQVLLGGGGAAALAVPLIVPLGWKPADVGGVVVDRRDEAVARGADERREKAERQKRADERREKRRQAKEDAQRQKRQRTEDAREQAKKEEEQARKNKNGAAEKRAREKRQKAEKELARQDARAQKERDAADAKAAKAQAKAEREAKARTQREQRRVERDAALRRRVEDARAARARGDLGARSLNGASPNGAWIVDTETRAVDGTATRAEAGARAAAAGDL